MQRYRGRAGKSGSAPRCPDEQRVVARPIPTLHPSKNARVHSKRQIDLLRRSIQRFGFVNPILIDKNRRIIAGHGRVKAAAEAGLSSVPTVQIDHLNEEEIRAYIIADNRLAEKAGWDKDLLAIELQELTEIGFEIEFYGFRTSRSRYHLRRSHGSDTGKRTGRCDPADQESSNFQAWRSMGLWEPSTVVRRCKNARHI